MISAREAFIQSIPPKRTEEEISEKQLVCCEQAIEEAIKKYQCRCEVFLNLNNLTISKLSELGFTIKDQKDSYSYPYAENCFIISWEDAKADEEI